MPDTDDLKPNESHFDIVVYNCAFFLNDITVYLSWAWRNLAINGVLLIANLARRFPPNFRL